MNARRRIGSNGSAGRLAAWHGSTHLKTVHAFPFPFLPSRARRPVWRVLALSLALGLPAAPAFVPQAAAQSQLPALGDSVAGEFSVATERQLGDRIMAQIRRDPLYLDDPLLGDYLQSVWQALLGAARARGELSPELEDRFAWQAFLVQDRTVNAFALPGGYVGVHLGLLATTATRDEFASVLAHELSHVTQRHIARSIAQSKQQSMLAVASMIIGMIAASRSPEAANALMVGGQAAALQGQLNFSRDMEREADRIGYGVLEQAGFSPAGMASMFERLQQTSRLNDSGAYPYLRTHPLTSERIGEARARAQSRTGTAPRRELVMVGVNVTSVTLLTEPAIAALRAADTPKARFACEILDSYLNFYQYHWGRRIIPLHDPLAAGILLDPSFATGHVLGPVNVVAHGPQSRAHLMRTADGLPPAFRYEDAPPTKVITAVDSARFVADFVEVLTRP